MGPVEPILGTEPAEAKSNVGLIHKTFILLFPRYAERFGYEALQARNVRGHSKGSSAAWSFETHSHYVQG